MAGAAVVTGDLARSHVLERSWRRGGKSMYVVRRAPREDERVGPLTRADQDAGLPDIDDDTAARIASQGAQKRCANVRCRKPFMAVPTDGGMPKYCPGCRAQRRQAKREQRREARQRRERAPR